MFVKTKILLLCLGLTLGLTLALMPVKAWALFGFGGGPEEVKPVDGVVRIPAAQFKDGKARFYKFASEGKEITFFAVQSKDGTVRTAFNACDVCWPAKKGYTQDGEYMICMNCGQRFHVSRIMEVKGGCNPGPLVRTMDKDTIVIKVEDLAAGAHYF